MNLKNVRCAVYTRKSTEEGLEKEFNSLDAQREAGEAFIKSQQHQGWLCLENRYDDGGFTGGNMERPALRRLLADINAGVVDCVVVLKVDRFSRSLLDFARMMEVFDRARVSFVSVTQQFNTATPMGRLILNVLLSFAQFEREMISERTRDKMAATRRKGRWVGGRPVLGYDLANSQLVVNEQEAEQVRAIFQCYLERRGLLPVVRWLEERGWRQKRWTTRAGEARGGRVFDKGAVYAILTNPTYWGQTRFQGQLYPGQHAAIVDEAVWRQAQTLLKANGQAANGSRRQPYGALLQGKLRCLACDAAMTPTHAQRHGRRYRYYACSKALKAGRATCPSRSLPARELEKFVGERAWTAVRPEEPWAALTEDQQRQWTEAYVQRVACAGQAGELRITVDEQEICCQLKRERGRRSHWQIAEQGPKQVSPALGRAPRASRLMALALRIEHLVKSGQARDYADVAALGRVSRARISQIMNLLLLASDIQEQLLYWPAVTQGRDPFTLADLQPIARLIEWRRQRAAWRRLTGKNPRIIASQKKLSGVAWTEPHLAAHTSRRHPVASQDEGSSAAGSRVSRMKP